MQRIIKEKEEEELLQLAADEDAKVSNVVVNSLYMQLTNKQINSLV